MTSSRQQSERLRKQRERQKDYRDRLRIQRKPTRDHIARGPVGFLTTPNIEDRFPNHIAPIST